MVENLQSPRNTIFACLLMTFLVAPVAASPGGDAHDAAFDAALTAQREAAAACWEQYAPVPTFPEAFPCNWLDWGADWYLEYARDKTRPIAEDPYGYGEAIANEAVRDTETALTDRPDANGIFETTYVGGGHVIYSASADGVTRPDAVVPASPVCPTAAAAADDAAEELLVDPVRYGTVCLDATGYEGDEFACRVTEIAPAYSSIFFADAVRPVHRMEDEIDTWKASSNTYRGTLPGDQLVIHLPNFALGYTDWIDQEGGWVFMSSAGHLTCWFGASNIPSQYF